MPLIKLTDFGGARRVSFKLSTTLVYASLLFISACSSTPNHKGRYALPLATPTVTETAASNAAAVADSAEALLDAPAEASDADKAPTTIAESIVERDLLDRIRAGFSMSDHDHISIDREVTWYARHPDYLDRTFRRGERYLYYIVDELAARKMPLELALLPVVESAFIPTALSHARAAGLWQFIPSTGKRYGLEQNRYYDGRRDVTESTRAALDYLQFLANKFDGDWLLAIAGYNCGEAYVARSIERNRARGLPTDFFSLELPKETRAYVPKLLAMRRIVAAPAEHGLEFGEISNQPYFARVDIEGQLDLNVAAQLADVSIEDLIALNPAYSRSITTVDGPQHLLLPVDRVEQFRTALAELSPQQRVPVVHYTVRRGDTLASIARRLGVTTAELRASNNIKGNAIRRGQELTLSSAMRSASLDTTPRSVAKSKKGQPATGIHRVQAGDTLWSIAREHGIAINALADRNSLDPNDALTVGKKLNVPSSATLASRAPVGNTVQRITYVVRMGDTLSHIARSFRVELADLIHWNKIPKSRGIKVGQRLVMFVDDSRRSGG